MSVFEIICESLIHLCGSLSSVSCLPKCWSQIQGVNGCETVWGGKLDDTWGQNQNSVILSFLNNIFKVCFTGNTNVRVQGLGGSLWGHSLQANTCDHKDSMYCQHTDCDSVTAVEIKISAIQSAFGMYCMSFGWPVCCMNVCQDYK